MRKACFSILLFASMLMLPLAAHADSIDDFTLVGAGNTISFSLPASPRFYNNLGAMGHYAGFFVTEPFSVTINGQTGPGGLLAFYSHFDGGLTLYNPRPLQVDNLTVLGPTLYDGSFTHPTFLLGTFDLTDYGHLGNQYVLTITPQTATVPEPPPFSLLLAGGIGLIVLKCLYKDLGSTSS